MILRKCYISSFGTLKDFSFTFSEGLNVFKEDNGWGKSTLATFIKCIFYGIKDGKRSVAENERTKFKPWNSTGVFGGYVEFCWGEKEYRLERFFGNKSSEDTVKLVDVSTGKVFPNTDNLGERIFKIDEDGFFSTTYFSQKDFQVKSNTSITAKFNSVCEVQDNQAFDKAIAKLEKKTKLYKMTGDKGLISDTKREVFKIDEEIQKAKLSANTAKSINDSVLELEKVVNDLKIKTDSLTKRVGEAGKAEANEVKKHQYENLLSKKQEFLSEKSKIENLLAGNKPKVQEVKDYINCNSEFVRVVDKVNDLEKDVQSIKNSIDQQKPPVKSGKPAVIVSLLGLALLIVSLVAIFTVGFTSPLAIFTLVGFVIAELVAMIIFFLKKNVKPQENTQLTNILNTKLVELKEYNDIKDKYQQKIDLFISKFNLGVVLSRTEALEYIENAVIKLNQVESRLTEIEQGILALGDKSEFLTNNTGNVDINLLRRELIETQELYTRKSKELANKRSDFNYFTEKADALSGLEEKKAELLSNLERYKEELEILKLTTEYFNKADEMLKTKYRAPLQDSLNKYLKLIDDGNKKAYIDIDLFVTVEEQGSDKVTDYYSKGYQNLFEICKRFALTDVLFKEEKPFIILDDPFYNLDDKKLSNALELVKKLSKEYQIIYLVCHESRRA